MVDVAASCRLVSRFSSCPYAEGDAPKGLLHDDHSQTGRSQSCHEIRDQFEDAQSWSLNKLD